MLSKLFIYKKKIDKVLKQFNKKGSNLFGRNLSKSNQSIKKYKFSPCSLTLFEYLLVFYKKKWIINTLVKMWNVDSFFKIMLITLKKSPILTFRGVCLMKHFSVLKLSHFRSNIIYLIKYVCSFWYNTKKSLLLIGKTMRQIT